MMALLAMELMEMEAMAKEAMVMVLGLVVICIGSGCSVDIGCSSNL